MAKRANEDAQGGETAAPALRLSTKYQSSSADIELRSKDGVRLLVHRTNLTAASTVFADMLETASSDAGERPVIDLEESAEVLERLLGYCYPQLAPRWVYAAERDQTFVAAIDKYHIPRAIEAGRDAIFTMLLPSSRGFPLRLSTYLSAWTFSVTFDLPELAKPALCGMFTVAASGRFGEESAMLQQPQQLSLIDQDLVYFLNMIALNTAEAYISTSKFIMEASFHASKTPCDDSYNDIRAYSGFFAVNEDDEEEKADPFTHALSPEVVLAWFRMERWPAPSLNETSLESAMIHSQCGQCADVHRAAGRVWSNALSGFQRREKLRLRPTIMGEVDQAVLLSEYRSWVKRRADARQ